MRPIFIFSGILSVDSIAFLILIISSFNTPFKIGVNEIIYANHLLRSAYPSLVNTARSILENSRSKEASDDYCMSIKEIITLIPEVN